MYHSYDVEEGVLYRVPEIGTPRRANHVAEIVETLPRLLAGGVPPADPLSKIEFLKSGRMELQLIDQQVEKVTDRGRDWLDYQLSVRVSGKDKPIEVLFRVDPQTKLPHLNRVTAELEGKVFRYEATFAYPKTGPENIYAIGVPPRSETRRPRSPGRCSQVDRGRRNGANPI